MKRWCDDVCVGVYIGADCRDSEMALASSVARDEMCSLPNILPRSGQVSKI